MFPGARRGRKRCFTRFFSYRKRSTASAGRSSARSTSPNPCSDRNSERVAQGELERAGPAGAEEPAGSAQGRVKSRRTRRRQLRDVIGKARIVIVVEAANIRHVEEVEDLCNELQFLPLTEEGPGPGDSRIE